MIHTDKLVIHIAEVKEEGLEVKGQLPASVLDLPGEDLDRQDCPNPLDYDLTVHQVSHGMLLKGTVHTVARCRCDRCLTYFDMELRDRDVCHFYEELVEGEIDATADLREDLLILLPDKNLCDEACKGICPGCGQNLNVRACQCAEEPDDDSPWHQLDDLHL